MIDWIKRTLKKMGPGFITGAADDDPAGIATYTQAGVTLGYNGLWSALFSIPFMVVVQEMCGRIGIVTGRGLAANMSKKFPKIVVLGLVGLLFAANTLNLGADIGMMAASVQLVLPLPFPLLVVALTLICVSLQIFASYEAYAKYLKWLTVSLIAYIGVAFAVSDIDWGQALKGTFLPSGILEKDFLMMLVAVLGTSISPISFFGKQARK
ncbi:divalent metal cation transporter [Patescibacteria group bacterium]|nr:divalent metal cation transporter [Patescibacteria group bacterium]